MARTNAERSCARLREDSECCGARPSDASELRDWCRNVSATSLLALDLLPNVAGIGTLHLLATLNSDLRSDVMQRVSKSERRGSGGWVCNGRRQKES